MTKITVTTIVKRSAHTMVAIGTDIYIFGGYGSGYLNDFYKIDTTNSYNVTPITLSSSSGTAISGRFSHTMVAIDKDIYIFGGRDASNDYLSDFYKINTTNGAVTQITLSSSGTTIDVRYQHKMVAIGTDIYIYGGINTTGHLNDFYKIDTTNSYNVTPITLSSSSGTAISGRYKHTMVAIGKDIYIFGGFNSSGYLNDFYKITGLDPYHIGINIIPYVFNKNVEDQTLTKGTTSTKSGFAVFKESLYIYGAVDGSDSILTDTLYKIMLNVDSTELKIVDKSIRGSRIDNSAMVEINNTLYIFGGIKYSNVFNNILIKYDILTYKYLENTQLGLISSRYGHSMVAIGTDIYIFGGYDSCLLYTSPSPRDS